MKAVLRSVHSQVWCRAALLLALPGCLVSFNDYPLGDIEGSGGQLTGAGRAQGGAASGGSAGSGAGGGSGAASGRSDGGSSSEQAGASALVSPAELVIDDFEDGDAAIVEQQGRAGTWYTANDGKAMQTPRAAVPAIPVLLQPARAGSTRGMHTFGGPFPTWGALIGSALAFSGGKNQPYDLSGYKGISFWVRAGGAPNAAKQLRFILPTPGTETGGGCTVCSDHFGVDVPLTAQWAKVEVPFSSVKQLGWGRPQLPKFDVQHVTMVQFLFGTNLTFDLWLDDVELY